MHVLSRKRLFKKSLALVSSGALIAGLISVGAPSAISAATGDVTSFPLPIANSAPEGLALDSDGNLWIAMSGADQLGKANPAGAVVTVAIPNGSVNAGAHSLALGSDGRMWVTEKTGNRIGALNTKNNQYQAFNVPTKDSQPMGITTGPDGAMWFTEFATDKIGRVTKTGNFTEFNLPKDSGPTSIVTAGDGALWFTMQKGNAIGRMTTSGVFTSYPLPNANSAPTDITVGEDKNLWFTQRDGNRIGRMTTRGLLAEFAVPTAGSQPEQITLGLDGELWFTQPAQNRVGRVTEAGAVTEFVLPGANNSPFGISNGVDGNIWFTGKSTNSLGRLLSGVTPLNSADPFINATSTKTGAVLTVNPGQWKYEPSTFTYQWQRCTAVSNSACADIPGATQSSYTLTDEDASKFVRVKVKGTNLNGTSTTAGQSAMLPIDGLPPKLPPAPVIGGQTVQLVPGITAKLKGAKRIKRGDRRLFRTIMSNRDVKGKVRMTIVDSAGNDVLVIAKGKWIKGAGKAKKVKRIPKRLSPGLYTLKAVYTPRKDQIATYPVATMSKPIRIRR